MFLLLFFILEAADGLKYYDIEEGKGPVVEKGTTVQVTLVPNCQMQLLFVMN